MNAAATTPRATVCAVVVTFNRKDELLACLTAILAQTHPVDQVVIVDNASTDGTVAVLKERGYLRDRRINYLALPDNRGGAGGFHHGFAAALQSGSDWIWPMDDDGVPAPSCLEQLIRAESAGLFRGPLVTAIEDASGERLAFTGKTAADAYKAQLTAATQARSLAVNGLLPGYVSPFNGVLIHRGAVERIGLPRAEFFIWGDEWDYVYRARKHGLLPTTVVAAAFKHPSDRTPRGNVRFAGRDWEVLVGNTPFRQYLIIRNYAFVKSRHFGLLAWVKHTLKYMMYERASGRQFRSWQVLKYSLEGLCGRMGGHQRFLQAHG